jgi:ubiquinone/menaquinone biosynthesis C-methylase UbiE
VARARLDAAVELVGEGPGRALDVGMGAGRLCARLERRGWEAYGVDPSEAMVALALKRLPAAAARLTVGRAEELAFADASFEAVTALGSLEYTDDVGRSLDEIARVLCPGGLAVVSWPNFHGVYARGRRFVLCPSVRSAKRLLPGSQVPPPRPRNVLDRASFVAMLETRALKVERVIFLGPRGGTRGARVGPAFAAQLLLGARKEAWA